MQQITKVAAQERRTMFLARKKITLEYPAFGRRPENKISPRHTLKACRATRFPGQRQGAHRSLPVPGVVRWQPRKPVDTKTESARQSPTVNSSAVSSLISLEQSRSSVLDGTTQQSVVRRVQQSSHYTSAFVTARLTNRLRRVRRS